MEVNELDKWWSSLKVSEKERIAKKVTEGTDDEYRYPFCTVVWRMMSSERKQEIHDHCTDKHGYLLPEWREGNGMSY